jgi:hypothetical protein
VAKAQEQFRNPEEGECLPLEAVTRGLVKPQLTKETKQVQAVVHCREYERMPLELITVMSCEGSINLITNPNPINSHSNMRHYFATQKPFCKIRHMRHSV